ncbi:hypothetical protein E2C01_065335 [Portunus trituberculatus]|uniref:Uncharacterized protein n=1 Tax=Portunus trituberculatus TaxID=210409 RepID=A0A5B7HMA9_PORTR|nr:hypothetical protein [Portunus trituberculatus]
MYTRHCSTDASLSSHHFTQYQRQVLGIAAVSSCANYNQTPIC